MYRSATPGQRTASALASAAVVAGVAGAMLFGLRMRLEPTAVPSLTAFSLDATPSPRPSEEPARAEPDKATGPASPANLRNPATPVVATPKIVPVPPPPIAAATLAAEGTAGQSGASDLAGSGQGAGGAGDGTGGGGSGTGIASAPRQIRGRLSVADFPEGLIGPGERASVGVRYVVEPDGRASTCRIERGSGFAEVDAMACRLITARFRFRPARDRAGQAVRSTVVETHTWFNRANR